MPSKPLQAATIRPRPRCRLEPLQSGTPTGGSGPLPRAAAGRLGVVGPGGGYLTATRPGKLRLRIVNLAIPCSARVGIFYILPCAKTRAGPGFARNELISIAWSGMARILLRIMLNAPSCGRQRNRERPMAGVRKCAAAAATVLELAYPPSNASRRGASYRPSFRCHHAAIALTYHSLPALRTADSFVRRVRGR